LAWAPPHPRLPVWGARWAGVDGGLSGGRCPAFAGRFGPRR